MCGVFTLSVEEADLLALMVATELDPGLGRVLAYLHDDGRLTQPTPWLAARLAGREPAPFAGAALLGWQLAAPVDAVAPGQRLMTPWQADPAVALSVFGGVWYDPSIADVVTHVAPEPIAALPCLHKRARVALLALADLREAELVGPPGIGRQTLAAQCRGRDRPAPAGRQSFHARHRRGMRGAGAHPRAAPGGDDRRARLLSVTPTR